MFSGLIILFLLMPLSFTYTQHPHDDNSHAPAKIGADPDLNPLVLRSSRRSSKRSKGRPKGLRSYEGRKTQLQALQLVTAEMQKNQDMGEQKLDRLNKVESERKKMLVEARESDLKHSRLLLRTFGSAEFPKRFNDAKVAQNSHNREKGLYQPARMQMLAYEKVMKMRGKAIKKMDLRVKALGEQVGAMKAVQH